MTNYTRILRKKQFRFDANVKVELHDFKTGKLLVTSLQKNLITDAGLQLCRDLIASDQNFEPTHIAVGTGTTAADALDTALETEVFRNTITLTEVNLNEVVFQLFITELQANGNTLTETGLFNVNAVAGDGLWARAILDTPIVKTASTTATITWTITLARDE